MRLKVREFHDFCKSKKNFRYVYSSECMGHQISREDFIMSLVSFKNTYDRMETTVCPDSICFFGNSGFLHFDHVLYIIVEQLGQIGYSFRIHFGTEVGTNALSATVLAFYQ